MKNIHAEITQTIIDQLETVNASDWQKPWFGLSNSMPTNVASKKAYKGINVLVLASAGFNSTEFGTYKQWQAKGAQVRKGEKGTGIIFYKLVTKADDTNFAMLKSYSVFNADQVDGYEAPIVEELNEHELNERVEVYAKNCNIVTNHVAGNQAFYRPSSDEVTMPLMGQFADSTDYYSTLMHEYTHATKTEKRVDRKPYSDNEYAFEELVAELGSAFQMAGLGLSQTPREDHVQYIKSWLQALKGDNKFIFKAAAQAQKACDWMEAQQPKEEKETAVA